MLNREKSGQKVRKRGKNIKYDILSGVPPSDGGKGLRILSGEIKTPPMGLSARVETGQLLRRLQNGEQLSLPHSRPMPTIGPRVHELRVRESNKIWRVIYRIDEDFIVVGEVFAKTTAETPEHVKETCRKRYRLYDTGRE